MRSLGIQYQCENWATFSTTFYAVYHSVHNNYFWMTNFTVNPDPIQSPHTLQANKRDYPVYHSVHDNFYWMSHFVDPDFSHHKAVGLLWMKTAIILTTNPLLPYDPRYYALSVEEIFQNLAKRYTQILSQQNITLGEFP